MAAVTNGATMDGATDGATDGDTDGATDGDTDGATDGDAKTPAETLAARTEPFMAALTAACNGRRSKAAAQLQAA